MKTLWLDVETTGLSCEYCDIVQLSGIVDVDGKKVDEFDYKLKPVNLEYVEQNALAVQGVTLEELMKREEPNHIFLRLLINVLDNIVNRYDKEDKMVIAGYNVPFDIAFLRQFFLRNNNKWFGSYFHHANLDVFTFVSTLKLLGCINPDNLRLETVCQHMGVEISKAHDSLNDIRATRDLFYKLCDKYIRLPKED